MNAARQVHHTTLAKRGLMVIDNADEHLLRCETGELWLTFDGDRRDVILTAGKSWAVTRRGPVVISAFVPSVLAVTHRPSCQPA